MGHIDIEAFNQRKKADLRRRKAHAEVERRKPFHARFDESASDSSENEGGVTDNGSDNGEESWRNSEGERLRDFGVDEEAEFYDEEDIPLAMLMQQRAERQHYSH